MCPLCIGTATLLLSGGTSAGGVAALFCRARIRGRIRGRVARRSTSGRVGLAPDPLEGQSPGMRGDELVNGVRPPGAGVV
jgi:hypothetical protein